ncbi:MAG: MFS transporter [Lachnospiraceae bacterium]|nr:MFS transporter [Lachnospiraceae bacterium]MCI9545571.1 MFS transporter [Lachnospiraceae bacterium]
MSEQKMANQEKLSKFGVAAILLMSSLTVMVGTAVTPAVADLGRVYNLGNYASWLITTPALGVVLTTILLGRIIDKKGPYWVAFMGLLCYGAFGVAGAYMPNVVTLLLDRVLLGAATAAILNASVTFISAFFKGEKQLKILALQSMAMECGGVIYLSVSGMLADISWRCPFYIYGLGFLAFLGLALFIPRTPAVSDNNRPQENDGKAVSRGVPIPLTLLISFLGMLMFFTAMVALPLYLQNQLGYSPSFTGYYLASIDVASVLAAGFSPNIVKRVKEKGCLTIAFCSYAVAFLLYFLFTQSLFLWIAACFVGIGFGFSTPLYNNLIINKSTPSNKGMNISFCTMAMFAGQFLSALLISIFSAEKLFLAASLIGFAIMACILPVAKKYSSREI